MLNNILLYNVLPVFQITASLPARSRQLWRRTRNFFKDFLQFYVYDLRFKAGGLTTFLTEFWTLVLLGNTILNYILLYNVIPGNTMLKNILLYNVILGNAMLMNILLCNVIPGNIPWWRHQMETFSAFFPVKRPVTWSFDVFFDLHLNKRLSKQWWGWWFDLRCHRAHYDVTIMYAKEYCTV